MVLDNLCIVDDSTRRLINLTNKDERSEDDIHEIICLVSEKTPKLLEGLGHVNKENIAKSLFLKFYAYDEVIFRQGDPPDAYYTVIRGAVSIYAQNASTVDESHRT